MLKFFECPETKEILIADTNDAESMAAAAGKTEIIPNTVDAAREKHVPVISREGQTVTVAVGEAAHPMLDVHYIGWILLETKNMQERTELKPGEEPVAQFFVDEDDTVIAAYAWCNLHGLWKAEG